MECPISEIDQTAALDYKLGGASFSQHAFSVFMQEVERVGLDGRVIVNWQQTAVGDLETGSGHLIFIDGVFCCAFFSIADGSREWAENIFAVEKILCRVWGIGIDTPANGNYYFEPDAAVCRFYRPQFAYSSSDLNELTTQLQELSVTQESIVR